MLSGTAERRNSPLTCFDGFTHVAPCRPDGPGAPTRPPPVGVHRGERRGLKFSYRQILASAGGAVLSAVIASIFGVKGTIVGVAIGSVAATVGTALLFQSIDRTHAAVKQVVVRVPEGSKLLHRLGGTDAAGVTQAETTGEPPATSAAQGDDTTDGASPGQPEMAQGDDGRASSSTPGLRWPAVAGLVAAVFVVSLVFVTVVELIAGRPLANLFGHSGGGTTVEKIFENNPAPTLPTTTTTTSSPTTTTSTTSTTSSSSSTTTTAVGSTSTSSTALGSASTTTTEAPGTSTSSTTKAAG